MNGDFKIVFFLSAIFFSILIISCTFITKPPLPSKLEIVPPSPDVPPDITAFSGIWEGKWGGIQDTIIVVERIDNTKADILISFGSKGYGGIGFNSAGSYLYITASVRPGPILEWDMETWQTPVQGKSDFECPCKVTFEVEKKLGVLKVYWEYINYHTKIRADLAKRK